ncbi:Ig-like domain-containing protein, partial [Pseudomonas fluorescens]|uniref:Ig-like domain-containing protein n=1 Tax=Pseudomonas fluorescens TaxID=294 RepID=UPI00177FCF03
TAPATPSAPVSYNDNVGVVQAPASTATTTDDSMPGLNVGIGLIDTLRLYVDGLEVLATYDSVTGTLTPNASLSEGSHELSYTLTDAAGNESPRSPALSVMVGLVTVDTTPPVPPGSVVIGDSNNNGTQDVSGTGTPGDTVVVTWPDHSTSTGTVAGDGTWVIDVPPSMTTDGPVTVVEKDPAGNGRPPLTVAGGIDVTAPATPSAPVSYNDNVGVVQAPASTATTTDDS